MASNVMKAMGEVVQIAANEVGVKWDAKEVLEMSPVFAGLVEEMQYENGPQGSGREPWRHCVVWCPVTIAPWEGGVWVRAGQLKARNVVDWTRSALNLLVMKTIAQIEFMHQGEYGLGSKLDQKDGRIVGLEGEWMRSTVVAGEDGWIRLFLDSTFYIKKGKK